jgi:hypothetical protein
MQWLAERWGLARIIMMTGFDPRYAKVAEHVGTSEMVSGITTPLKPISVARLTSLGTNGAAIRNNRAVRSEMNGWDGTPLGLSRRVARLEALAHYTVNAAFASKIK